MPSKSTTDSPISVLEAARTLYRSTTPSDEQILRVCRLMRTGALRSKERAGSPLDWTTTPSALADFLALSAVQRSEAAARTALALSEDVANPSEAGLQTEMATGTAANNWGELSDVYREIWRDYFLVMLLRRRIVRRGAKFQRAVVTGQAILLIAMVSVLVTALFGMRALRAPAGNKAILRQIDASTDDYSVTRWHPAVPHPAGEGELIRVEYRYRKDSNRWIHTQRTFHVTGNGVVEVGLDDDS